MLLSQTVQLFSKVALLMAVQRTLSLFYLRFITIALRLSYAPLHKSALIKMCYIQIFSSGSGFTCFSFVPSRKQTSQWVAV